ncbi:MAG: DNA recombination protein RmuC [Alphaproteobacteria bacterium]|nr:DNA recombination protein RmuC [Alphaproteobacteria bacterium]
MDPIWLGVAFALGAVITGLLVWVVAAKDLRALRETLAARDAELGPLRGERDQARQEAGQAREQLANAQGRLEQAARQGEELVEARKTVFDLNRDGAALRAQLEAAEKAHGEQVAQLTRLRQEMQDQFQLLAGQALKASNEEFAKRAEDVFKAQKELTAAEIDKRSLAISELVKPLGETLKAYEEQMRQIEAARKESYGGLKAAIDAARVQNDEVRLVTANLVTALKASPKTRGRWGEETLRRVMELSGMVEHCDFETEKHFRGEDESLRPDVLISVSGGRTIVVDAKAPVTAYLDAIEATCETERETLLVRHARQLRERLTNLSHKSYWEKVGGSTDCVVMFVPGDNFVSAAFERDPNLFEDGIKNRVLICTPTTFIALAKAISYGWRQEKLAQNATDVARLGKELYARLATLGEHVTDLGKHINNAAKKYNAMVGSLESNVMPQARRFHELGVEGTAKPLSELSEVDVVVRLPQRGRDLRTGNPLQLEGDSNLLTGDDGTPISNS